MEDPKAQILVLDLNNNISHLHLPFQSIIVFVIFDASSPLYMYIRKYESSVINRNQGSLDNMWTRAIKECSKKKQIKVNNKFGHKRAKNNFHNIT